MHWTALSHKHLQAKKRHHHVWANYLLRWGSGTNNVFYTTKTGKIAQDSVHGIAVEDYFYKTTVLTPKHVKVIEAISRKSPDRLHQKHMSYLNDFLLMQHAEASYRQSGIQSQEVELHLQAMKCNPLENLHASHEENVLPVLAALAEEKLDVLQNDNHMVDFLSFFGHQISRTKTMRDSTIPILSRGTALETEVADTMAHAWWFLSYIMGMSIGFSLYKYRHTARHALLINNTSTPFITSDQPVVNVHSCVSETVFGAPEHSDLHYPISPRVAYIICDSDRFTAGKNDVDEMTVKEFNTKVAAQAMVHIIGDSKNAIQPFQKYIGRRHKRARLSPAIF